MKMIIAKVYPENNELLYQLYDRIINNTEYFLNKNQDVTMLIRQNFEENCLMIKSLKLEESVN